MNKKSLKSHLKVSFSNKLFSDSIQIFGLKTYHSCLFLSRKSIKILLKDPCMIFKEFF